MILNLRQHPPSTSGFHSAATLFHDLPLRSSPSSSSSSYNNFSSATSPASSFEAFPSATASPSSSLTEYPQSVSEYYMPGEATQSPQHHYQHLRQQHQQQQQQAAHSIASPATIAVAPSGADDGSFQDASWYQPNEMAQIASPQQQHHHHHQQQQQQQQQQLHQGHIPQTHQPQQQSRRQQRFRFPNQAIHLRENSGSTIVSAGPSSPFASSPQLQPQAYPRIVDSDSQHQLALATEGLDSYDQLSSLNSFPKPIPTSATNRTFHESLFSPQFENFSPNAAQDAAQYLRFMRQAMAQQQQQQQQGDQGRHGQGSEIPTDAMSISRTQSAEDMVEGEPKLQFARAEIPPFDRTMSEIYQDELYNPPSVSASTLAPPQQQLVSAPSTSAAPATLGATEAAGFGSISFGGVSDLIQAASGSNHAARSQSPTTTCTTATTISRDRSPYHHPSHVRQLAEGGFPYPGSPVPRDSPAVRLRERQIAEEQARAKRNSGIEDNPTTVSPKELLENHHEADDDGCQPSTEMFFPPLPQHPERKQQQQQQQQQQNSGADNVRGGVSPVYPKAPSTPSASARRRTAAPPTKQYQFMTQSPRRQVSALAPNASTEPDAPLEFPAQLTSMDSTKSETAHPLTMYSFKNRRSGSDGQAKMRSQPSAASDDEKEVEEIEEDEEEEASNDEDANDEEENEDESDNGPSSATPIRRPANTTADSGAFTCTYHGCTMRFETPARLQKHKREAHRQTSPSSAAAAAAAAAGGSPNTPILNSQAGPHRCDRINPSTGKQCNSIFSRPYDLTRHEDTIHNARKQKVRCQLCAEEKTFSRNDALTRHMRVVHPDVDFPGKSKKRNG